MECVEMKNLLKKSDKKVCKFNAISSQQQQLAREFVENKTNCARRFLEIAINQKHFIQKEVKNKFAK